MRFTAGPGRHPLGDLTGGTITGSYIRLGEDNHVCILSVNSAAEGNGYLSSFLNELPLDETIEVDNVINPILAGALARRGFTLTDDGSNAWVRPVQEQP